ncbi:MAG: hypothetical protein IPM57_06715 [Oligoflexia bacterium]|nr:hypothetical protein [Oligoflexia bacterium]
MVYKVLYRLLIILALVSSQVPIPKAFSQAMIPFMYIPMPKGCPGGSHVYTYTGAVQTHTVPSGCYAASVKIWSAGGGGSYYNASYGSTGGAGGFATANLVLTPGETINVVVGGGGSRGMFGQGAPVAGPVTTNPGGWGGGSGLGNGGNGGGYNTAGTIYLAGGGGGSSGIYRGAVSQANTIIIVGGGGGGAALSDSGQRDSTTNSMRGKANYEGSYVQCYDGYSNDATSVGWRACANNAANMDGANGSNASGAWLGGGGGGGWIGGSSGGTYASDVGLGGAAGYTQNGGAGQGVSGYSMTNGSASSAPGTGDGDYTTGVAVGGNSGNSYNGGPGKIVFTYTQTDGICTVTKTAYTASITMYTVPEDCSSLGFKVWGAGGGGGSAAAGGGGGYIQGVLNNLLPGQTLRLYVGTGGQRVTTPQDFGSGGGGGLSRVTNSNGTVNYLIAGAGGGGGRGAYGGAGGGSTGQAGAGGAYGGGGGTQVGGGAAGAGGGVAGSASNGGAGAEWSTSTGGGSSGGGHAGRSTTYLNFGSGGGGAGYYGGGGGGVLSPQYPAYGGGGGSSWYDPTNVSNATLSSGNLATAGNSSDADRSGYADGGTANGNGDTGIIVVTSPDEILGICPLPWGGSIVEPSSVTAYSATSGIPGFSATCTTNSEQRVCQSNNTLTGSFTNQNCTQYCAAPAQDVTISAATNRVSHPYIYSFTNNQPVYFSALNGGVPLNTSTVYYLTPPTSSGQSTAYYTLRSTPNGATIDITSDGVATTRIVPFYSASTAVDSYSTNTGAAGAANCVAAKTTGTCQSSGSFSPALSTYLTCGQQCNLPWGGTISSTSNYNSSVTAYSTAGPLYYPSSCASNSQTRTCQYSTGTLTGSYTNQSCDQQCCGCTGQQMVNCNPGAGYWPGLPYITNWAGTYCVAGGGTCYTGGGYCWTSQYISNITFNCPTAGPESNCVQGNPAHTVDVTCPGTVNATWNCDGATCSPASGYSGTGQSCTCF